MQIALTWPSVMCFPLLTTRTYTVPSCREPFPTCCEGSLCIYSRRIWYHGRFPGVWIYDWTRSGLGRKEELSVFPGGLNACFTAKCVSALAQVCECARAFPRICHSRGEPAHLCECSRVIIDAISEVGFLRSAPSQRRPIKAIRQRSGSRAALRARGVGEQRI